MPDIARDKFETRASELRRFLYDAEEQKERVRSSITPDAVQIAILQQLIEMNTQLETLIRVARR